MHEMVLKAVAKTYISKENSFTQETYFYDEGLEILQGINLREIFIFPTTFVGFSCKEYIFHG